VRAAQVLLNLVLAGMVGGCVSTQNAYVHAPPGYSQDRIDADKVYCFREAQGNPADPYSGSTATTTGPVVPPPTNPSGLAVNLFRANVGASALGGLGDIMAAEAESVRRYPPDPEKYEACLTKKGYMVQWPENTRPAKMRSGTELLPATSEPPSGISCPGNSVWNGQGCTTAK